MLGRVSAIEGALAQERGGRMALVDSESSDMVVISESWGFLVDYILQLQKYLLRLAIGIFW